MKVKKEQRMKKRKFKTERNGSSGSDYSSGEEEHRAS
jgi:hypothetical protein